jgi:hypothetical protein
MTLVECCMPRAKQKQQILFVSFSSINLHVIFLFSARTCFLFSLPRSFSVKVKSCFCFAIAYVKAFTWLYYLLMTKPSKTSVVIVDRVFQCERMHVSSCFDFIFQYKYSSIDRNKRILVLLLLLLLLLSCNVVI